MSFDNIQYFPFAPGIPWKMHNGKYIVPSIDKDHWDRITEDRDISVIAYGGLFESLFSFSILETVHSLHPDKKLYWAGDSRFNELTYLSGIANISNNQYITESVVQKYPTPIFLDSEKFVFFNCLNNYINVFSYTGSFGYHNNKSVIEQIYNNSCFKWNNNYPKLRNITEPIEFNRFSISRKFNFDLPFVFIAPDCTGWSDHFVSALDWSAQEVKSFVSMLAQIGINVVIMSNYTHRYAGIKALLLEPNLKQLLWILPKAKAVLGKDIDILLASLVISKSKIIGLDCKDEFNLKKNRKFLNSDVEMATYKTLSPYQAFLEIK